MKHNHIEIVLSIGGLAALFLLLNFTSPTEIFGIIVLIMRTFYRLTFKRSTFRGKDYLYSAILAFGPIMLLMARSFGAINLWTVSLMMIFIALAEFLVYKRI